MPDVDYEWVKGQLKGAKVPKDVGNGVLALFKTYEGLEVHPLNEERTAEVFAHLAQGRAMFAETEDHWIRISIGAHVEVGDTVRVRADAFPGDAGRTHNGRTGRVVAKRSGDVIVKSTDDREPAFDSAHYPPDTLEKLVRRKK